MKEVWTLACVHMHMKHTKNEKQKRNRNWNKMKLFEKNADVERNEWIKEQWKAFKEKNNEQILLSACAHSCVRVMDVYVQVHVYFVFEQMHV